MITSKVTSKSQTTLPKEVREALSLGPGDHVAYQVKGNVAELRKAPPLDLEYLEAIEGTLSEWSSAEDAEAYDDL